MTHKKQSAGGCETTTADTKNTTTIISSGARIKGAVFRFVVLLLIFFRGLA